MAKKNLPSHPDLQEDDPQEQIARIAFQGWKNHLARFGALQKKIEGLLDEAVKKALARGDRLTSDDIGKVFQKHPEIKRDLEAAIETLNKDLVAVIEKDSKDAWLRAQTNAQGITKTLAAGNAQLAALLASGEDKAQNDRALRAFMKRKEAGMDLSDRVWKTTLGMKLDMERAIDVALAEGMSADRLSLKIRELLKEPHRLYRRVRDKDGNLRLSQAAQKYHPGTGVYRSSYKNAMRVARTEVNMAYQTSDSERWANSWWVKGIRVSLSNNHTIENAKGEKEHLVDICDELAGDYPPDFKFTGWHPQCRCFATAITVSYDEIREYYRRKRAGEDMTGYEPKGLIKEPPQKFKNWMERNADRLTGAAERGTTPYFITNNPKYTDPEWKPAAPPKPTIQQRMDERHANRTPAQVEEIMRKWENRKEYIRLKDDPNYTDVKFNPENGGLMATHIDHNFDKEKGWYEKRTQEIGFINGHSVILEAEDHTIKNKKNIEGKWDGLSMEIAGVESGESQNIRNGLKHCAGKNAKVAVLYFLKDPTEKELTRGIARFNGLRGKKGQWVQFKEIWFVFPDNTLKKHSL